MVAFLGPLLSAGLSAGVGLAGINAQNRANAAATNLGYLQLYETRRRNKAEEALAKSSREDAYGNQTVYVPGLGFRTKTTPLTAALLNAEQKEQHAQLTRDAPRNRAAAERRDTRSQLADEEFKGLLTEFRNRERPNRKLIEADERRRALLSRDQGRREAMDTMSRAALRMNNSGALQQVANTLRKGNQESLEGALSRAAANARQAYGEELSLDQQEFAPYLQMLAALADGTTTSPVGMTDNNQRLTGQANGALTQLLQTMQSGTRNIQSAYGPLMAAAGRSADYGPLAAAAGALSRINFGAGGGSSTGNGQKFTTIDYRRRNAF